MPLILSIALHRYLLTWQKKIDRFIVLSEFNKSKFVDAGIPIHKIRVKPNFVKSADVPLNRRDNYWVFIGRIKEEKGIQLLPRVWKHLGECAPILHVLGDGPFLNTLKLIVLKCNLEKKIILHGQCSSEKVQEILRSAKLMILPSICYEGFPMVVVEAYEAGVPVAASRLGSLADIVKHQLTGILFQPGDIEDMAKKLQHLANNQSALIEMSVNARKEYDSNYGSQKNFDKLREIYLEAIEDNHKLNNSANKKSISQ
jgi:glycosyltransferase involved in cell wall biosynthesis